jgi:CRP-like cAMP-binding protein
VPPGSDRNRLLAALPVAEYTRLLPRLRNVALAAGDVLSEPGARIRNVYFPRSAVMSMIGIMQNRAAAEVGTVGDEGFVGLAVLLGARSATTRCVAQIAGDAARMSASTFLACVAESAPFAALLHRYTHAFLSQVAQTAACNVLHPIGERCARWLLMTDDRATGDGVTRRDHETDAAFVLTQEYLSYMLGVRREAVSRTANRFQADGLIRYTRGRVTVLDRRGLEAASCECYALVRGEQARLLG